MKRTAFLWVFAASYVCFLHAGRAAAWHDETHLAIAKAAGYAKWYNAAGADMAKEKARLVEGRNHYYNNTAGREVTAQMVLDQAPLYNNADDREGHLYGAIIASLREYAKTVKANKYAQYHIAYCAHYLGDLSQPQHNTPLDEFNKEYHEANDGIVDRIALNRIGDIEKNMYAIELRAEYFEADLAREVARIANVTRDLDAKLRREKRAMRPEEAYRQLGHSASLLKAVLGGLKRQPPPPAAPGREF